MDTRYHYLLLANYSLLSQILHEQIRNSDLSPGQPKVLIYLLKHNGVTQKELAKGCFLTPGALTTILNGMMKRGMVERRHEGRNQKEYHIYMTDYGRKLADESEAIFAELDRKAMAGLSEDEQYEFIRMFYKIYNNYEKTSNE